MAQDLWSAGEAYEPFIGRWSRLVARQFVPWVGVAPGSRWLEVGSGTGALTATILAESDPAGVLGVEPSDAFRRFAEEHVPDGRAAFRAGSATEIPAGDDAVDVAVAGLVLNFVDDRPTAMAELRRVTRPGGTVAAYVWDYAGGMQLLHRFWEVAVERDPAADRSGEAGWIELCLPEPLHALFVEAGLTGVRVEEIVVPTVFRDFDDYWTPFLGGQGPAPAYVATLPGAARDALREALRGRLPREPDGTIALTARAWAVRGSVPR